MSKMAEGALKMALKKEEEGASPEIIDKWLDKAVEYEQQGR